MGPILLLAGVLVLIYAIASLSGAPVAADSRLRRKSRAYVLISLVVGVGLLVVGIVLVVGSL